MRARCNRVDKAKSVKIQQNFAVKLKIRIGYYLNAKKAEHRRLRPDRYSDKGRIIFSF